MYIRNFLIMGFLMLFSASLFAQPEAPQNLTANSVKYKFEGISKVVVNLNWNHSMDSNGKQVPVYEIFRKDGDVNSSNAFASLGEILWRNSKVDADVVVGNTYTYYVVAKDFNKNMSNPSNNAEVIVTDDGSVGTTTATVTGIVTDEVSGLGLEGAFVTLFNSSTLAVKTVTTNNLGEYEMAVLAGEFIVYFRAPQGYFHEYYDNALRVNEATFLVVADEEVVTGIDAALTPINSIPEFTLSGNVSDSEGNPVEAKVKMMVMGKRNFPIRHRIVRTDENGNYSFAVREGSEVIVFAMPKNRELYSEFYNDSFSMANAERISITEDVANIDFILDAVSVGESIVSGAVMNVDADSIDAMVMAIKLGAPRHARFSQLRSFVDEAGNYSFEKLSAGDYVLFCMPEDGYLPTFYKADGTTTLRWRNADVLTLADNEVLSDINFNISPMGEMPLNGFAEIMGTVRNENGDPISDAYVHVLDAEGKVVSYCFTNREGKYNASSLTPGYYSVAVDNYGFEYEEDENVYAGTDGTSTADFNMVDGSVTDIENEIVVNEFNLHQNYPNPFNPSTTIKFSIMENAKVELKIYDIIGREIKTLVNRELNAGSHNIQFDASNLPSGMYVYEVRSGNFLQSRKMLLLK
ncbi:MAG: T9SS type A sorting domain-containing protein [Ignavibacteriae bacterium]|nr:T9SS type A sorting domain-containing protein [Ignavibacteriota bacterium]